MVTDVANEKDVGPDNLRGRPSCAEPAQRHRARRCHRNEPKQPERCGEKGKMMHEGAVRVMAEGASGRALR